MDAVVSGSAGVALLVDGDRLWSLRRTVAGVERVERRASELRYLLGDARDLAFLEDSDEAAALRELDAAHGGVAALHLALMLCDPSTSDKAAGLSAGELDALLASAEVAERAERILDAKPVPAPMSIDVAIAQCRGRARAVAFFEALASRQATIGEVRRAWDVLPSALFESGRDRAIADGTLAREGLYRSLVRVRLAGQDIDAWLREAQRHPAVLGLSGERWLAEWVQPLRPSASSAAASVDPAQSALINALSTQGGMEVAQRLRKLDLRERDHMLDALARAVQHTVDTALDLALAILRVVGGVGDIQPPRDPPTSEDQRWASRAARRLAPSSAVVVERCERLYVPAMAMRKTVAPAWVPRRRAVAAE
jgi:hypothetical protein